MSHLEMESLLHYERNLAACYEAEYLLELTMQREYINGSMATNWARYEGSDEIQSVTSRTHSSAPFNSLGHTRAAGERVMMDTSVKATSNHHNQSTFPTNPSFSGPAEASGVLHTHQHSHSPLNHISHPQTAPLVSTPNNNHHLLLPTPLTVGLALPHQMAESEHGGRFDESADHHLSLPHCEGVCVNGVTETHSDGPQRKRMCLQRPEM